MINWTTALSLLCAYASALPHGTSKTETLQAPITVGNQSTPTNGGYVYITITYPNTTTYTSTIFSTITSHPTGNNSVFTITKTAAADMTNGTNLQTPKQNSSLQALSTVYVTKSTPIKQHSTLTPAEENQNANAAVSSDVVETVSHTIFNTISAKKRPHPVTHWVTVTRSTVTTGKPATILTFIKTVTTTFTTVIPTKTVTSNMKLTTQSDGKSDIILWKRNHPEIELFENGSTATSVLNAKTIGPRAVPAAPQQTSITVTKTYTPATTVYTTKTITVSGTWVPRANSTTTTMTIPATIAAGGGGSQTVDQQINAISVLTKITVEPIVSTIAPPPPTTTAPPPTTSIKTVDMTKVVTVSNHHTSTIHKTTTHVVTSTIIPPSSVLTKTTFITDTTTSSAIYTKYLVTY